MTRFGYVLITSISAVVISALSFVPIMPRFIWNASASAPVGLYLVQPDDLFVVPDLVVVAPPEPLARMLDQRGFLPAGVPLLKRIIALPGQRVCRHGRTVTVDGIDMAEAHETDQFRRALPVWQGCQRIADGAVFLLNWQHPDSLDGRYFGPLPQSAIIGRAIPLLTDEERIGQFEWRAPIR
ncbi:S26 family signal peptidase [Pelagibacterium sp.]|uniref:S26 family signal peptidase n=1 Tax=Pelagibacterium sp. TaxID=1967288 RepID=UPI003BAD73C0